jgi:hypothetical protein
VNCDLSRKWKVVNFAREQGKCPEDDENYVMRLLTILLFFIFTSKYCNQGNENTLNGDMKGTDRLEYLSVDWKKIKP